MQNKVDEAINAIKAADEYNLFTERYKTNPPEPVNFRWEQIEISRKIYCLSFFLLYLLDLMITDMRDSKIIQTPTITDHQGILITCAVDIPPQQLISRPVWNFKYARWRKFKAFLKQYDFMTQCKLYAV